MRPALHNLLTVLHSKVASLNLEFSLLVDQLLPVVQDPGIDVRGYLDLLEADWMESWDNFRLVDVGGMDVEHPVSCSSIPAFCLVAKVHFTAEHLGHGVVEPSKLLHHLHASYGLPITKTER